MASRSVPLLKRWIKPEVYPLVAMMSAGLSFMTYTSISSLTTAPDVLITKNKRQDGIAPFTESQGQTYKHGPVRELVRYFYDFESTSNPLTPSHQRS